LPIAQFRLARPLHPIYWIWEKVMAIRRSELLVEKVAQPIEGPLVGGSFVPLLQRAFLAFREVFFENFLKFSGSVPVRDADGDLVVDFKGAVVKIARSDSAPL